MASHPVRAAFQGALGAFSQQAVQQLLGPRGIPVPCQRFDEVFTSLIGRKVEKAVIPIENTLHGSVHENYDHLLHFPVRIIGETNVRIVHNLIACPGVSFKDIRRAYSHPVALNQCLDFFAKHPQIEKAPFYDTAGSVKSIMEERPADAAAIASALAAEIYGGKVLKRNIEDDPQNFTRFFLIEREGKVRRPPISTTKKWKTSVAFTTRNVPGALFRALSAFALRDINLTKIESRPLRGKPWEYLFYLDFLGRPEDEVVKNALRHLGELADLFRLLGSYPPAE